MNTLDLGDTYDDIRVCDLSQGVAGPHATMLLAQFGADVIKVEPPDGDWGRALGDRHGDHCAHSFTFNRGKRSLVLDLKSAHGQDAVRRLIVRSDVFVESFRPGVADRLGLGYEAVRSLRSDIVYASLSGFGQNGPYSRRGTVDALMQGFSGMMVMNRTPDGLPQRQNMTAVDVLSGLYLYSALATALARRRKTGQGGYLDISLMQSAAAFQAAKIMEFHLASGAPKPLYMPAGYLRTKDGAVSLSTMRQAHYEALCNALGRSDLVTDPRFAEIEPRIRNGRALMAELEGETSRRDTAALLALLQGAGVFVERVQSYGDWLQDEHVRATASYRWVDDADFGSIPVVSVPGETGQRRPADGLRAPAIGEHTDEILGMLGLAPG